MKTVAYVRVSTDTQDVNHQRLAILEFGPNPTLLSSAANSLCMAVTGISAK